MSGHSPIGLPVIDSASISGVMQKLGQPTDLQERVAFALGKLGSALKSEERVGADNYGLYATQLQILSHTLLNGGASSPSELAAAQGVNIATISDSLAALENKGLIKRIRSKKDARRVVVRLTARGRNLSVRYTHKDDILLHVVQSLNEDELAVSLAVLQKLIAKIQAQGRISVSAMCSNCTFFQPNVYRDLAKPHHCGFVDAPFGDADLRNECADFQPRSDTASKPTLSATAKRTIRNR